MTVGRVIIDLREVVNECFVVMPLSFLQSTYYGRVVLPAVEAAGLRCSNGGEMNAQQMIVADVWRSLRKCRVVVADVSGCNPNVLYEIGLAHALGKPIVLLTRRQEDVPFDLRGLRYIYYDVDNPLWGPDLQGQITARIQLILGNPSVDDNLSDISIQGGLPEAPTKGIAVKPSIVDVPDLAGVWTAEWLSIRAERRHEARLVIPSAHGEEFIASITIRYMRGGEESVIDETFKARIVEKALKLEGIGYSYVRRGASVLYSLDKFELRISGAGTLVGKVILSQGERDISFSRVTAG